jgi:hypothetical protein
MMSNTVRAASFSKILDRNLGGDLNYRCVEICCKQCFATRNTMSMQRRFPFQNKNKAQNLLALHIYLQTLLFSAFCT